MAKEFKVSTDYILGLSTVSVRKSYDISELGLSEGAVRGLVTGAAVSYTHLVLTSTQARRATSFSVAMGMPSFLEYGYTNDCLYYQYNTENPKGQV